jgi:hypothetical protein
VGKRRGVRSSIKGIWYAECLDGGEPRKRKIAYAQRVQLYTCCHVPPRTEYALANGLMAVVVASATRSACAISRLSSATSL